MAILENRVKINSKTSDLLYVVQLILKRFLLLIFVVLFIYLLYVARPKKLADFTLEATGTISTIGLNIYDLIFSPMMSLSEKLGQFKDLKAENLKLKLRLTEFYSLENTVETLKAENSALKNLLNVVSDEKYDCITARLLSVSLNPFSKTILVGAGSESGVKVNQIVASAQGLVGRVTQVSGNFARVMLINDLNSRVPIVTLLTQERGILAGNNQNTKIIYLQKNHTIKQGEKVITSGDGIMYPRGIVVGEVSKVTESEVEILPAMNFDRTDFVNIFSNDFKFKEIEKIN